MFYKTVTPSSKSLLQLLKLIFQYLYQYQHQLISRVLLEGGIINTEGNGGIFGKKS